MSFFVLHDQGQRLGLVDTEGTSINYEYTSTAEIKEAYNRDAWNITLIRYADELLAAMRVIQGDRGGNFDQFLALVRASELPMCKALCEKIDKEYEANMSASCPRLVRDLQAFHVRMQEAIPERGDETQKKRKLHHKKSTKVVQIVRELTAVVPATPRIPHT